MAAYGNSLQNWKPALERRGARGSTDRNALPVQVSRDELQREVIPGEIPGAKKLARRITKWLYWTVPQFVKQSSELSRPG
jgi:hypothetical protein